jgi:single-strand DNA-binding protein
MIMLNVVVLVGRMVADPELKYTPSGVAVCSFRIAVDRWQRSESGEKQADFFDIVAWRQSAEFVANYLTKGRLVSVNGRLQQRSWVQQDGQKRYKVEVVANEVQGLDSKRDSQGGTPGGEHEYAPSDIPGVSEDAEMNYDPFAEE